MTQGMNTAAIASATGRDWDDWRAWLDGIGAADLPHADIVHRLRAETEVSGWWAQSITVAYAQAIGRRVPGQDCNGRFSVSVSRTLAGSMDELLEHWERNMAAREDFSDVPITDPPRVTRTDKWRYWRCGLADGSRVNINIQRKAAEKAGLTVQHDKLDGPEAVEHWRGYWKALLQDL